MGDDGDRAAGPRGGADGDGGWGEALAIFAAYGAGAFLTWGVVCALARAIAALM